MIRICSRAARKQREEQISLLRIIDQRTNVIIEQNREILKRLDGNTEKIGSDLQIIIQEENLFSRLYGRYVRIERNLFDSMSSEYRIRESELLELRNDIFEICRKEIRFSKLIRIPGYLELIAQISGGSAGEFISRLVREIILPRMNALEATYAREAAEAILFDVNDAWQKGLVHNLNKTEFALYPFEKERAHNPEIAEVAIKSLYAASLPSIKIDIKGIEKIEFQISDYRESAMWDKFVADRQFYSDDPRLHVHHHQLVSLDTDDDNQAEFLGATFDYKGKTIEMYESIVRQLLNQHSEAINNQGLFEYLVDYDLGIEEWSRYSDLRALRATFDEMSEFDFEEAYVESESLIL